MKISDILADWILDTELFEKAYQRKKAIEIISGHQHQIATHLVKHLYYEVSDETKKHWEAEINAWLGRINALKLKNGKRLSSDVYYKLLFDEPLGELTDVEGIVSSIDKFEGMAEYDKIGTIHALHEKLEKILHRVSYDVANDKLERIGEYIKDV